MNHWEVRPTGSMWAAGLVDEEGQLIRLHPLPFMNALDAERGAARLNAKYAGIAGVPAPVVPEEQARAARQARIAELRARRSSMSNDKVAATFHPEGDDEQEPQTIAVPGIVHMTPEDPTAPVPHAHMDEH